MTNSQESKCDRLWATIIRLRVNGICERTDEEGHCPHHIKYKRHSSTRWDLNNGIWLEQNIHNESHDNPEEFKQWLIEQRGEEWYRENEQKSNTYCKPHYETILKYLITELEKYD